MVPRTFLLIFHAGSRRLSSNKFRNSSYKEKRPVWPLFLDYLSASYDYAEITCCKIDFLRHKFSVIQSMSILKQRASNLLNTVNLFLN